MRTLRVASTVWRELQRVFGKHRLYRVMSLYPPFVGAGIRVAHVSSDLTTFEVEMRLRPWNRNYVGTQFGGSLYAMTDPFFMLILLEHLGSEYIVWDKSASIRYLKPGRGSVRAKLEVPPSRIDELRRRADAHGRAEETFEVDVVDESGEAVARVSKVISVRRKRRETKLEGDDRRGVAR